MSRAPFFTRNVPVNPSTKTSHDYEYQRTRTGEIWGPLCYHRLMSDSRRGVWILIAGKHEEIEIRVTPGGRLRVSEVRDAKVHRAICDQPK